MTLATATLPPKNLLTRGAVALHRRGIMRGERADIRDNAPALLIFEPRTETGHFGTGHADRYDAKKVSVGVAAGETAPRKVGSAAATSGAQSVTARARHAELDAAQFDSLCIADERILGRPFVLLSET